MEQAGLTALPVEVIHHISRYLSVQDVLSCSLTCHYLRSALNDNYVWRKYLPQEIPDLETQEQQVAPILRMGESLTQLCEKRQEFTRKTNLLNNWRAGNYVQYTSSSEYILSGRQFTLNRSSKKENLFYKDKYIFLHRLGRNYSLFNNEEKYGIDIWDVSIVPPRLHTFINIEYCYYRGFHIIGSHLIILECLRVNVYQINLPDKDFPLLYSFLITENNATFKAFVPHTHNRSFCTSIDHSFVRNYLMSSQHDRNILHIWDIHSASKIGSFEPPWPAFRIRLHSYEGNICMFQLLGRGIWSSNYLITFNLDNNQFSNNRLSYTSTARNILSYNSHIIIINSSIKPNSAGLFDIICTLYDFNTLFELRQRRFTNAIIPVRLLSSSPIMNGTFIITCHDSFHVVNALTLEPVSTFRHHTIKNVRYYFNVYQNVIVEVTTTNNKIELWDVSRKDILLRELNAMTSPTSELHLDSTFTKLVIIDKKNLTVVHFW